jgi:sulfate adenylyltransferase
MNVSTEFTTIEPHGGELVDRLAPEEDRDELLRRAEGLTKVVLGPRALSDLEMISTGVFSPLTGFMVSEDYESVVEKMRLKNGLVWSLPITLPVSEEEAEDIRVDEEIALADGTGRVLATMIVEDRYSYDKEHEAQQVFGTTNDEHPGVAAVYRQKDVLLGGEVTLLVEDPNPKPFPEYHYKPRELREAFAEKGWTGFLVWKPTTALTSTSRRARWR